MNTIHDPEGEERLTGLLRRARTEHPLPAGFKAAVWGRLSVSPSDKMLSVWRWMDELAEPWLRPRYALTAAVLVVAAGLAAGLLTGAQEARGMARERYLAVVAPYSLR